jgi:cytidylate kinase
MRKINIAIDGPSGVGKSTIAKMVSEKLDYLFINTGLMYRSISYFCIQNKVDIENEVEVVKHLNEMNLILLPQEQITLNGVNITRHLREDEISISASKIARYKEVRIFCVSKQQKYTTNKGVIMEGRDIGSVVIPDAELKIFLNANLSIRSERRIKQLQQTGELVFDEATVTENISKRDEFDANRSNDPLKKMPDAIEIDTSYIQITEVVEKIIELAMERIQNEQ